MENLEAMGNKIIERGELDEELKKDLMELITTIITTLFRHVDVQAALEEFRNITGTAESHELDDFLLETLDAYKNEESVKMIFGKFVDVIFDVIESEANSCRDEESEPEEEEE